MVSAKKLGKTNVSKEVKSESNQLIRYWILASIFHGKKNQMRSRDLSRRYKVVLKKNLELRQNRHAALGSRISLFVCDIVTGNKAVNRCH